MGSFDFHCRSARLAGQRRVLDKQEGHRRIGRTLKPERVRLAQDAGQLPFFVFCQ